ncbi:hypothetical protein [Chitinolyticbacter albus]|uniref:hypothetical protein n=1 Tax=Chitinolyticbacter albus TaxID=2961951 RepID=UPI00210BAAD2|nr:hypothetical protein [Chitinolyticbacter albus]
MKVNELPARHGIARLCGDVSRVVAMLLIIMSVVGCERSAAPRFSDPVKRKNGVAYIPIDNTALLIPEKTWLKGYARNSTDGLVSSIALHATIPDVQPWSEARNDEMYWQVGPGKKLEIAIKGNNASQIRLFSHAPSSIYSEDEFVEEPSDQAGQGLRRFRMLWTYKPKPAELDELRKEFGADVVDQLVAKHGSPKLNTVYYESIESGRVKYLFLVAMSEVVSFKRVI